MTAKSKAAFEWRYEKRSDVATAAVLREAGGSFRFPVDVVDLSMSGLRFETSCSFGIGSRVFITLPSIQALSAKIAWRRGRAYGARFDRSLHPAVLALVVERFPALPIVEDQQL